ncbi:hypothetical protein Cgig2_004920 [Carnegiea gigantea]|uniref:Reverse transcriptase zinc-binding domain-containing protein n=1 Tax=Carnegiea gigantea TaxID=171969 RepID=A0A9Q1KZL9_9CARY|nr:hypothetical protein Cgig2_004920 [Carnegiea gigantea]
MGPWKVPKRKRLGNTPLRVTQQKLPVLQRLGRFSQLPSIVCGQCQQGIETQEHLFFGCHYAREIWDIFLSEWQLQIQVDGMKNFVKSVTHLKMPRKMRNLMYAGINAVLYNLWHARNSRIFSGKVYPSQDVLKEIKRQVTHRVLQLHQLRVCVQFVSD